jgi:hypothetical protein
MRDDGSWGPVSRSEVSRSGSNSSRSAAPRSARCSNDAVTRGRARYRRGCNRACAVATAGKTSRAPTWPTNPQPLDAVNTKPRPTTSSLGRDRVRHRRRRARAGSRAHAHRRPQPPPRPGLTISQSPARRAPSATASGGPAVTRLHAGLRALACEGASVGCVDDSIRLAVQFRGCRNEPGGVAAPRRLRRP